MKKLEHPHVILGMFVMTLIIQTSDNSINPIINLYIQQLLGGHGNVTLISGVIASTPGIATLIVAPHFGRLDDRIGSERILTIGLILAIFVYLPMVFVQNVWQLAILRLLVEISGVCLLPAVQTLITRYSPSDAAGHIFSYDQPFQATGNMVGPMVGPGVSAAFDYRGVFISTSYLVLLNLLCVRRSTAELKKEKNDD